MSFTRLAQRLLETRKAATRPRRDKARAARRDRAPERPRRSGLFLAHASEIAVHYCASVDYASAACTRSRVDSRRA